jgi:hypothetical protein
MNVTAYYDSYTKNITEKNVYDTNITYRIEYMCWESKS